jgi:hypothetical protein
MEELVPSGSACPYRLEDGVTGARLFCISNALWPCISGCLSDNLAQFTPEAEILLTLEVLSLNSSICITEIVGRLDAILRAIKSLDVCCALDQGYPGLEEPPADIERGVGDPPVGETWDEYDAYLCCALQKQVDLCDSTIDTLTDGLGGIGLIGLDALALYLAPLAPPVALLLAFLGVLTTILEDELYDQWSGELDLYAHDAICAAWLSYTPETAKSAVDATIDQYVVPAPNRILHKMLWSQTQLNRIFRGEIEGTETYDPDYCDTCEVPPEDEWTFDAGLEGWFLYEGYKQSYLEYNGEVTHTPDGTGCAVLYLDEHWYGTWWSRIQVNTAVEVVANQHVGLYHSKQGTADMMYLKIIFDDDTSYGDYLAVPPESPNWGHVVLDVPGAHIGKSIVALRLSYKGNNAFIYIDDVSIYVA